MGAGTGPLTPQQRFKITVQFLPQIPQTHEVYLRFRDAVRGLLGSGRFKDWDPTCSGSNVTEVKIVMGGPIANDDDAREFNRAFNRILWGVRVVRPGDVDNQIALSKYKAKVTQIQTDDQQPTPPNWLHESIIASATKSTTGKSTQGKTPKKRTRATRASGRP